MIELYIYHFTQSHFTNLFKHALSLHSNNGVIMVVLYMKLQKDISDITYNNVYCQQQTNTIYIINQLLLNRLHITNAINLLKLAQKMLFLSLVNEKHTFLTYINCVLISCYYVYYKKASFNMFVKRCQVLLKFYIILHRLFVVIQSCLFK